MLFWSRTIDIVTPKSLEKYTNSEHPDFSEDHVANVVQLNKIYIKKPGGEGLELIQTAFSHDGSTEEEHVQTVQQLLYHEELP